MIKNSKYSPRYLFFLGLAALLIVVNLLIANDYVTIWEGAEANMLLNAQSTEKATNDALPNSFSFLPEKVVALIYAYVGFNIAQLRYISVIILLLAFLGIYHWGRKIFGEEPVLISLVVMGGSFLISSISKLVVADIWLFATQSLYLIFLILYIKQPIIKWLLGVVVAFVLGLLVNLPVMLIWGLGLSVYFLLVHPNKTTTKNILLKGVLPVSLLGALVYFTQGYGNNDAFVLAYGNISYWKYLLFSFVAVLPWLGFLIAALLDVFVKIKSREELAIISLGWLIFGLLTMSLAVQFLFAYLIAKHVLNFLKKPYPYDGLVKSVSLFILLLSFIGVTLMLIGGWQQLGAGGYQSALAVGALYWGFGFLGVMGLFLKEKRFILGGFGMSVLLVTFAFWGKVYPLVEKFRELPRQLSEQTHLQSAGVKLPVNMVMHTLPDRKNFQVYLNEISLSTERISTQKELDELLSSNRNEILIYNDSLSLQIDSIYLSRAKKVIGNVDVNQKPQAYWIVKDWRIEHENQEPEVFRDRESR